MGIVLSIPGEPIPWQRPARRLMCGRIITFDTQRREKEQVRWQMRGDWRKELLRGPVRCSFTFYMPIPASASRKMREQMLLNHFKHMCKPDVDNLVKFYMDCMTGAVYVDDKQVWACGQLQKIYSEQPGVRITVIDDSIGCDQATIDQFQEKISKSKGGKYAAQERRVENCCEFQHQGDDACGAPQSPGSSSSSQHSQEGEGQEDGQRGLLW